VTLNVAETSVVKSRPSVIHRANLFEIKIVHRMFFAEQLLLVFLH